nr:unnamed protein product [Naegleria fowleri]
MITYLQRKKNLPRTETVNFTNITLLMVNDVYEMLPDDKGVGGLAELSTMIDNEKSKSRFAIATLNGDFLSASTLAEKYKGAHMIDVVNQMPIFDFGSEVLEQRIAESRFSWICSNIVYNNGDDTSYDNSDQNILKGCLRKKILTDPSLDGLKIGLFGLCTKNSEYLSRPGKLIKFLPSIPIARKMVNELRNQDKCDVVIALTHLNIADDKELVKRVPGIDIVLGGHDHEPFTVVRENCLIHKAGHDGQFLTRIDLRIEKNKTTVQDEHFQTVKVYPSCNMMINHGYKPKKKVADVIEKYMSTLPPGIMEQIGVTESKLYSSTESCRTKETTFGNFVADLLLDVFGCEIAMFNGGGIRGDRFYDAGKKITRYDMLKEFPFPNELALTNILGKDLLAAVEEGVQKAEKVVGAFPHFSKGIKIIYDSKKPPLHRVVEMTFNGDKIDEQRVYRFATVTYLLKGGDGYTSLQKAQIVDHEKNNHKIFDIVVEWIEHHRTLKAEIEHRIVDLARETITNKWSGTKGGEDDDNFVQVGDNLLF